MKNGLSKFAKDRVLITAMLVCILLATGAAMISYYNRQKNLNDRNDLLSENQTQENNEENDSNAFESTMEPTLVQAEPTEDGQAVGDDILVKLETTEPVETEPEVVETAAAAESAELPEEPVNAEPETEPVTVPSVPVDEPVDAPVIELNFSPESRLLWPVDGEIIREFSMDTTVWFSTLQQYKVSDAIQIQSEAGTDVLASADAQVIAVGTDDELGNFLILDIGSGYRLEYGQLADVTVNPGDYVTAGSRIASVAAPTYYYTVDGDHLYFQLSCNEEYLDPLDYLQ